MTETPLMQQIRAAVNRTGRGRLMRNNTVLAVAWARRNEPDARPIECGLGRGGADLVGLLVPSGRGFALEVKTPTGRLSDDQRRWLASFRKCGGFATCVRSVDEALSALERAQAGASE